MLLKFFFVCFAFVVISGCSSKDEVYRSIYNGMRNLAVLEDPERKGPPAEESMTYDRYKLERERALERDSRDAE